MSKGRQIRVYDYVNQPFERVRAALLANTRDILSRATNVAGERTRHLAGALRINIAEHRAGANLAPMPSAARSLRERGRLTPKSGSVNNEHRD